MLINSNTMKIILSIILFCSFLIRGASAQDGSAKPAFSVNAVTPPARQSGNLNYLLSLSEQNFKNNQYVFYTDSNATVAYINVDGKILRLTGGTNPEHIMAYFGNGYTVTLGTGKNMDVNNTGSLKIAATLAIYNRTGNVVVEKVTGEQFNAGNK